MEKQKETGSLKDLVKSKEIRWVKENYEFALEFQPPHTTTYPKANHQHNPAAFPKKRKNSRQAKR
ncbi:MAG: hypothetical protein QXR53_00005, partial [Candidatus Norongarragalinales archaeon]